MNIKDPNKRVWRRWFPPCEIIGPLTSEYLIRPSLATTWYDMMQRCYNPKMIAKSNYRDRIFVCVRWMNYNNFVEDRAPHPGKGFTLDRIDNTGHYTPDNCGWRTNKEQQNNKRNNRKILYNGELKTLAQWAEHFGCKTHNEKMRFRGRWNQGYKLEYCNVAHTLYAGAVYGINKNLKRENY